MIRTSAYLGLALVVAGLADPSLAQDSKPFFQLDWCGEDGVDGYHFYCDDKEEEEAKAPPPEQPKPAPAPLPEPNNEQEPPAEPTAKPTAVETLAAITQELEELKAAAILEPEDPAKVAAYMRAQQWATNQASKFSDQWRRVVWEDPTLDYTLRRPTEAQANNIYHDQRNEAETRVLKAVAERFGFFFVFEGEGTCATCGKQAEIIERLATRVEVNVLGVSRDGSALAQFPNPLVDSGQLKAWGYEDKPVPAILMVDPGTGEVQPVTFGLRAEAEILERVFVLTQSEIGDLY